MNNNELNFDQQLKNFNKKLNSLNNNIDNNDAIIFQKCDISSIGIKNLLTFISTCFNYSTKNNFQENLNTFTTMVFDEFIAQSDNGEETLAKIINENINIFWCNFFDLYDNTFAILAKYLSPILKTSLQRNYLTLTCEGIVPYNLISHLSKHGYALTGSNYKMFDIQPVRLKKLLNINYKYDDDMFKYIISILSSPDEENITFIQNNFELMKLHIANLKIQNKFSFYILDNHILTALVKSNSFLPFMLISPEEIYNSFSSHIEFINVFKTLPSSVTSLLFFEFLHEDEYDSYFQNYSLLSSFFQQSTLYQSILLRKVTLAHNNMVQKLIENKKNNEKNTTNDSINELSETKIVENYKNIDFKTIMLNQISDITSDDYFALAPLPKIYTFYFLKKLFLKLNSNNSFKEYYDFSNITLNNIKEKLNYEDKLYFDELNANPHFNFKTELDNTINIDCKTLELLYYFPYLFTSKASLYFLNYIYSDDFLSKVSNDSYFYSNINKDLLLNHLIISLKAPFSFNKIISNTILHKNLILDDENINELNKITSFHHKYSQNIELSTYIKFNDIEETNQLVYSSKLNSPKIHVQLSDFFTNLLNEMHQFKFFLKENEETRTLNEFSAEMKFYLVSFNLSINDHTKITTELSDEIWNNKKWNNYAPQFVINANQFFPTFNVLTDSYLSLSIHKSVGHKSFFDSFINNLQSLNSQELFFIFFNLFTNELPDELLLNKMIFDHFFYLKNDFFNITNSYILNKSSSKIENIKELISLGKSNLHTTICQFLKSTQLLIEQISLCYANNNDNYDLKYEALFNHLNKMSNLDKMLFITMINFVKLKMNNSKLITECLSSFETIQYLLNDVKTVNFNLNEFSHFIKGYNKSPTDERSSEDEAFLYTNQALEQFLLLNSENTNDIYKKYEKLLKTKKSQKLRLVKSTDMLIKIEYLYKSFPHFEKVIQHIENMMLLSNKGDQTFYIPPTLLLGGAGVGKTFFVHTLCKLIKTAFVPINTQSLSASFILHGSSSTWSGATCGLIFTSLFNSPEKTINPVFLLDEIEKAGGHSSYSVANSLLPVLERYTSKEYKDECVPLPIDASNISWFATANSTENMSKPLLSRFDVFSIPSPNIEQREVLVESIYQTILENNSWGSFFNPNLPQETKKVLAIDFGNGASRDLRKILTVSCSEAIKLNKNEILPEFLPLVNKEKMPWDL